MHKIIIIGGGAAGLFGAASCNKTASGKIDGLIIEKKDRAGRKLLMSGAGQCNITHGGDIKDFINHYGAHGKRIRKLLYSASNSQLISFVESLGVPLVEREDGKVFPVSLSAEDVRSSLVQRAADNGFEIVRNTSVIGIEPVNGGYRVRVEDGREFEGENVVIATGGRSYPGTGSDGSMYPVIEALGVSIVEPAPALVPVFVQDYGYSDLSGISFKNAEVVVRDGDKVVARNVDDLLLTHKNFSGPAVINISRDIRTGMTMTVNYVAPVRHEELTARIKKRAAGNSKSVTNFLAELTGIPSAFVAVIASECEVEPSRKASTLTGAEATSLARAFACHDYSVSGLGGYNEAMVTRGGVALDQIDMKTMGAKALPGLYFVGEVVDIDGDTGGYNLQFAYASAVAAMRNILE